MGRRKANPLPENTGTPEGTPAGAPGGATGSAPSRSEYIREALSAGIESPTKIVEAVKEKYGVEVSVGLVSQVKNKVKGSGPKKRVGRPPANPEMRTAPRSSNGLVLV